MGKLGIDPSTGPDLAEVIQAQGEKANTLVQLAEISTFFYRDPTEYPEKMAKKAFKEDSIEVLEKVKEAISGLQDWTSANLHELIEGVVQALGVGFGKVGAPVRLALTGGSPSPDIGITLYLVGKAASMRRLDQAIAYIKQSAA
jgi:glutamyl-tRNA synthetase